MKIIACSGKKQSGKTTAVVDLRDRITMGNCCIHFADTLKMFVAKTLFGVDCFLDSMKDVIIHGKTGRQWLQIVGTDWFRNANPDCWINAYKVDVADYADCWPGTEVCVLTADVRFPNEVKCIQALGGHVRRLLRNPHDDKHASETALDMIDDWHYYATNQSEKMTDGDYGLVCKRNETISLDPSSIEFIDNREMSVEQQNEAVWKLLNERGWVN